MMLSKEEFANALSHGLGSVVFLLTSPYLFMRADRFAGYSWPVIIYALCLLFMYANSTLYHATITPNVKSKLQVIDHISIFLLIGGTFTPIVVYNMGDWNGLPFLAGFWGVLMGGMVYKVFFTGKYRLVSTLIYVGVAWVGAFFAWPMVNNMPGLVMTFVIVGGIFYTAGTFFYMRKRMPYHHAIWHIFVLAGSASHFYAIILSLPA